MTNEYCPFHPNPKVPDGKAHGVATVGADVTNEELRQLHDAGARAVRFNFVRRLVDVALVSLNAGGGRQDAVEHQGRGGLCYISLDNSDEGVTTFKKFLPAGDIVSLPQNENINGLQDYAANIISIPWMMLTNTDTSEDLDYTMTKAIAENKDAVNESFGAFGNANIEEMAPAKEVPYHPGARKDFAEAGLEVGGLPFNVGRVGNLARPT